MTTKSTILLENSPYEVDGGHLIGRDPRKIPAHDFDGTGIAGRPVLSVIRDKCVDCSGGRADEVRKCVAVDCALWPYRMASNPFRTVNLTDEERERRRNRLKSTLALAA
jgi:hypothetical protein